MLKGIGRLAIAGGVVAIGAALAVPFAPSASALAPRDAKGLGKDVDWINSPALDQFEDLKGQVIFVDLWGIN